MQGEESAPRLLWILFSDANSRMNTLIEECAHLQDTILGLVSDANAAKSVIGETAAQQVVAGFARPVACNPQTHARYHALTSRDRAFLSLWNSLGGLIVGLAANQTKHREAYESVANELVQQQLAALTPQTERLYWYVSLRGYILNQAFLTYTAQLEHAHEKLIQMLENQAATLPTPLLFRRWNSAIYGEFLSEYSRHVNWEAMRCMQRLVANGGGIPTVDKPINHSGAIFQSLTHTWTHYPTSVVRYFDVGLNLPEKGKVRHEWRKRRFAMIQSAYFYLEQPVLFPLLYHECVHINFPDDSDPDHKTFFGARMAAIKSLRLAKFPVVPADEYENFWDHFTEEVWSDAIATALGGRAYLSALALQLFGLSGIDDFNHYRIDENTIYPIDELGGYEYRKYEIPYPALEMNFLWEARLLIASSVLLQAAPQVEEADREIATSIEKLIDLWWESGEATYSVTGTSLPHQRFWKYRRELSKWVCTTISSYLDDCLSTLKDWANPSELYEIKSPCARKIIEKVVNDFRNKYFESPTELRLDGRQRLENVAIDVRWAMAGDVVKAMRQKPQTTSGWTSSFANWMRGDGSAAFRLALEASRVRLSLMDALADRLSTAVQVSDASNGWVSARLDALDTAWLRHEQKRIVELLRRRMIANNGNLEQKRGDTVAILRGIDAIVDDIFLSLSSGLPRESDDLGIGTLGLGVVRPMEFSDHGAGPGSYERGLRQVRGCFSRSAKWQAWAAAEGNYLNSKPAFPSTFIPLIGEYQFLNYACGSTPMDRDFHPRLKAPRMLVKQRLVLHVGGLRLEDKELYALKDLWARVALIRFRYAWQWHDIRTRLEAETQGGSACRVGHYSLYLSSSWEHAVLVTWHASPNETWRLDEMGLGVGGADGVDIQSTYYVPLAAYEASQPVKWADSGMDWFQRLRLWAHARGHVASIYQRSGRFDYSVVWRLPEKKDRPGLRLKQRRRKQDRPSVVAHLRRANRQHQVARVHSGDAAWVLRACAAGLASMPRDLWAQVTGMITSFEELEYARDHVGPPRRRRYVALTHFAVRDRQDDS